MKFRNQRHKELFNEAIRRLDKQNNTLGHVNTTAFLCRRQTIASERISRMPFIMTGTVLFRNC